ncbi:MAG: hypothetical protein KKB29_00900, partial [Nanoarchaeota archaeon]|nr:hypothetical protein [Nanoarchaeota archaeon]
PVSKEKTEMKKGRISKARGARFELKVRADLESKGRVVDKWSNNVDLEKKEVIPVKRLFKKFSLGIGHYRGVSTIGTGFPDFISIKPVTEGLYSVIGVEVKMNGTLSKIEKQKCAWYLENKVFSSIWIAKAVKKGKKIEIEYDDFKEKYGEKYNKT